MQYHIQTGPIWETFRAGDDCPLCKLYRKTAQGVVSLYLNEAVMEPDFRVKVNAHGFCPKHLKELYEGENKLGLGLEIHTRSKHLLDKLKPPANPKDAKKKAESLLADLSGCVICDEVDEIMERYAYTVAQMYMAEPDFPSVLNSSYGFCLPHYALLLKYSDYAKKSAPAYLNALYTLERKSFAVLTDELESFTLQYDYRAMRATGSRREALPKMIRRHFGTDIKI